MLTQLKKNDEVLTSGGIYGKVIGLTDTVITLEVAPNVRIRTIKPCGILLRFDLLPRSFFNLDE